MDKIAVVLTREQWEELLVSSRRCMPLASSQLIAIRSALDGGNGAVEMFASPGWTAWVKVSASGLSVPPAGWQRVLVVPLEGK